MPSRTRAPWRSAAVVCLKCAAALLLSAALAELALQALSLAARRAGADSGPAAPAGVFRILCLGESTTAPPPFIGFSDNTSWPAQLQLRLNAMAPGRYRVINKGRFGTNSSLILARVPDYLREYSPDLVIAMAGVNDDKWFALPLSDSPWNWLLNHSRLLRLLRFTRDFSAPPHRLPDPLNLGHRDDAERTLKGIRVDNENPLIKLAELYAQQRQWRESRRILDDAARQDPDFSGTMGPLQEALTRGDVTAANLRSVASLVRGSGAVLALMQYPTLDVGPLTALLGRDSGVVFIENRENFSRALRRKPYGALFFDRFGGGWGHCTTDGNRLIVDNVVAALAKAGLLASVRPVR